jgi:hypothetical protein
MPSLLLSNTHIKYRPDIDGLRAIAVLVVVAFHAFPEKVKGGFIGVDIFFVISGFLITSIIFQNLKESTFSFLDFFARRVRRIFPALILVLAFCYAVGWFTLLQDEYQQLGKHIGAGSVFISNFALWNEIGYFDNASETKVLLHLWSLGIEEQFYLIWPLLAFIAWKRKLNLFTVVMFVCLTSFAINIVYADKDRVLDFFSPQTRFWELFVGSALAWISIYRLIFNQNLDSTINKYLNNIIYSDPDKTRDNTFANVRSAIGALLLLIGFVVINNQSVFPGWLALLPVLGAMLLISAGMQGWLNRTILSNPILVWIGLISFPLYLWHWPLLTFGRIFFSEVPPPLVRGGLIIASFIFAWLTYQLVEKPIRFGKHKKIKTTLLVAIMVAIGYLGLNTDLRQGFPFRKAVTIFKINNDLLQWDSYKSTGCSKELGIEANFCIKFGNADNIKVAVIGDSTGNSIAPGLGELLKEKNIGLINIGGWTCPPILGLVETPRWGKINKCPEIIANTYRYLERNKSIETVIFAVFAADLKYLDVPGVPFDAAVQEKFSILKGLINQSVQQLTKMGKKIIITYDAPYSNIASRDCIPRPGMNRKPSTCNIPINELPDRHPNIELFDSLFKDNKDICIFSQAALLLNQGHLNFVDASGYLLLRDTHHLSYWGSRQMAEKLMASQCMNF